MADMMASDPARSDELILVDAWDKQTGTATKERAHREGLLHRAFSVELVRHTEEGLELLVTRRAAGKYHSAGLWTNSCCSHPRTGEELLPAVERRLQEELGVAVQGPQEIGAFVYRAPFANGIVEYEYDHVFVAQYAGQVTPNPQESDRAVWMGAGELARRLAAEPEAFAPWSLTVFPMVLRFCETL